MIALFMGRFQPPTRSHANTLEKMLERWRRVHIGVSDASIKGEYDPVWEEFVRASASRQTPQKRIFSAAEVVEMWSGHINHERLQERVTCTPVQRPHLRGLNQQYPPGVFDIADVIPHDGDSDADRLRHECFSRLLQRAVHHVVPDFMLHNSEIEQRVHRGAPWSDFLTPGVLAVFERLGGPVRIATARAAKQSAT